MALFDPQTQPLPFSNGFSKTGPVKSAKVGTLARRELCPWKGGGEVADVGGAYLTEGPAQRCTSPVKPSTVTSTLSVGFRRLRLASPGPVGGAVDVARAGLAADARPGAHPGGLNRLKLTVDLIFNQSKSEKKPNKKRGCSLVLVFRVAAGWFSFASVRRCFRACSLAVASLAVAE